MSKKIEQALILMEKANSLLKEAQEELDQSKSVVSDSGSEVDFLKSNNWPQAVNPNLICSTENEADKKERASGIVELMIEEDLEDKKFLDFGCGEGDTALVASTIADISVGYDIVQHSNWEDKVKNSKVVLTSDMNEVEKNGPYDVILLFDVLDHVGPHDDIDAPQEILEKVNELLKPDGTVYLRCHPWISRHATHMYHWMNKAFAHVVYTDEELKEMGVKLGDPVQKVVAPILTYHKWINLSDFKIENERTIKEPVEEFFKSPKIADRIRNNTAKYGLHLDFPDFQMSIQFIDYVLKKK